MVENQSNCPPNRTSKRRPKFRFGLRRLFVFVTLICLALGLFLQTAIRYAQRKSQARTLIVSLGGHVSEQGISLDGPPGRNWLTRQLGMSNWAERLWTVDLSGTAITGDQAAKLDGCDWIRSLNLSRTKLEDDDLKFLQGLPKLRWLKLNETQMTDGALPYIKQLKRLLVFESKNSGISWEGLTDLDQSFDGSRAFADLSIKNAFSRDCVVIYGRQTSQSPKRDEFHLHLIQEGRARTVRVINSQLFTEAKFGELRKLTDIRSFSGSFGKTPFPNSEFLQAWQELRSLSIDGGLLTDEDFRHIAALPKLRYLSLVGFHDISDRALLMLGENESLTHLRLDGRQNSLEITRHLGGLKSLESLSLSAWKGRHKAEAPKTESERVVATIEALQRLKSLPSLEHLLLHGNAFSDKAILSLAELTGLKQIIVPDRYLAPETIQQLQDQLPNCDVRTSKQGYSYSENLD